MEYVPESKSSKLTAGTLQIDETIGGRYRVLQEVGRGGMGIVYKVEQIFLHNIYALKLLNTEQTDDKVKARFQKEAQAAHLLDHPNLIKVHDFGLVENNCPFLVMTYVEGTLLSDYIKKTGPLPLRQTISIFKQLCDGLQFAHDTGVIHRDFKPSNIMLTNVPGSQTLQPKILDFGIAKIMHTEEQARQALTRTGEVFGSPLYMSPEQCFGLSVDHRSDIYSFGCALYESLTGFPPFVGDTALSTMMRHQNEVPASLKSATLGKDYPESMEAIVAKLLRKDPNQRYQSIAEVKRDLELVEEGRQIATSEAPSKPRPKVSKTIIAIGAIAAILILCVIVLVLMDGPKEHHYQLPHDEGELRVEKLLENGNVSIPKDNYAPVPLKEAKGGPWDLNFPTDGSLGEIGPWPSGADCVQATGTVHFDHATPLGFKPGWGVCEKPQIFRRFRPDEIWTLRLGDNPDVNDDVLLCLDHLSDLKYVYLWSTEVTDKGLAHIQHLKKLEELKVSNTKGVTGYGIAKMDCLKALHHLDADHCKNMGAALAALNGSAALQSTSLRSCDLTDQDLNSLCKLSNLVGLTLDGNENVTDSTIIKLAAHFPKLQTLSIWRCNVTPKCTEALKGMKHLSELTIRVDDWSLHDRVVLQRALPNCKIRTTFR